MDKIVLPEPEYYTISMLAERWGCSISDVMHYGRTGQLRISVLSDGWWIEYGSYDSSDDEDFPVPSGERWSRNELLPLFTVTISDLIKYQKVVNPGFVSEKGTYQSVSSNRYTGRDADREIEIFISDLMVSKVDKLSFENEFREQKRDSETTSIAEYITPYIQLMFKAIKEKNISKENQGKADDLCEWFMSQKIDGQNISETAAKKMTTFIRLPESKKGGNKPFKKG